MRISWRNDVYLVWRKEDRGLSDKCGPDLLCVPPEAKMYLRGNIKNQISVLFKHLFLKIKAAQQ